MKERACPVCEHPVIGRTDKIFCSAKCKSVDQYERRRNDEKFFLFVDRQLKINRRLLKKYNRSGFTTLRSSELQSKGFDSRYFTHYWKNRKGDLYLFCYDYGYLTITKDGIKKYVIVKWQEYMHK